jgi:hypothetical protein
LLEKIYCSVREIQSRVARDNPSRKRTFATLDSHSEVEVARGETGSRQILEFVDSDPGYGMNIPATKDETFDSIQSGDSSLGEFLSRPVKIYEDRWSSTLPAAIAAGFNPWKSFCENPAVFEKLKYFNNLSGSLVVKAMINGNAFMYGRLMLAYEPLPNDSDLTNALLLDRYYVPLSQRPHILLNPTSCEGGTMHLPFFWYKNYLSIPERDWDDMGEIAIVPLNPLLHASGENVSVTITVYAYMEDVVLTTPTALQSSSLLYSHGKGRSTSMRVNDEYGKGIISKPASAVAAAAGWLNKLPVVIPYARATEMIATRIGQVATLFGYSRPPNINGVDQVKVMSSAPFAVVDRRDEVLKLTLDSKNELTIDPRTVGLAAQDHMGIVDIAQKQSYLGTTRWATYDNGDIPGVVLFNSNVTPALSNNVGTTYSMTPMAFMSQMFEYWHGTITFRFQVVASNFHKGRLLLQYDPNGYLNVDANKQYSEVIDIAETRDFEVDVGWGVSAPFLKIRKIGDVPEDWATKGTLAPLDPVHSNGQLTLTVLNELTVPGDPVTAPDIYINIWVKACEDIKFAVPDSEKISTLSVTPEMISSSLLESHSDAETMVAKQENKPLETMGMSMNTETTPQTDHYMEVFMGEHVTSLRDLFRRYCFHTAWKLPINQTGTKISTIRNKVRPFYRASYANNGDGVLDYTDSFGNSRSINPVPTFPLTYCMPAFVAWRGAIRRKVINNNDTGGNMRFMCAQREPYASFKPGLIEQNPTNVVDFTRTVDLARKSYLGTELTSTRLTGLVEFESPFYQNARFRPTQTLAVDSIQSEGYQVMNLNQSSQPSTVETFMLDYVATGEDFTLFWFLNVPRMFRYDFQNDPQ